MVQEQTSELESTNAEASVEQPQEQQSPNQDNQQEPLPPDDPTRQLAERTATPFNMESILLNGYGEQEFSVTKRIKVRMRSLRSATFQFLMREFQRSINPEDSSVVFDEVLRSYYLAGALISISGSLIGPDLDEALDSGDWDKTREVLESRLKTIKNLPVQLVGLLYAHFLLFNERFDKFLKEGSAEMGNY